MRLSSNVICDKAASMRSNGREGRVKDDDDDVADDSDADDEEEEEVRAVVMD
jgi:hypothetical protein